MKIGPPTRSEGRGENRILHVFLITTLPTATRARLLLSEGDPRGFPSEP
jgi:hypothetical protein